MQLKDKKPFGQLGEFSIFYIVEEFIMIKNFVMILLHILKLLLIICIKIIPLICNKLLLCINVFPNLVKLNNKIKMLKVVKGDNKLVCKVKD